ncbi:hypothetical protein [Pseudoclavibacter sp. RFBB5]|uniref:hypothetical protein n=1 Tax=Pseudoclavibacter sp. RFBB5 TaxID=2080574 RepID=UPI0011B08031|nr:hypothetical protein [Pseudoclavibacter sp. RFBB5]
MTLKYQWLRHGSSISGATAATYRLTAADAGERVSVKVTGSKTGHTTASKTSTEKAVPLQALTATPAPTVSGTAKVGQTLTAKAGSWAPSPVTLTYQWLRNGVTIGGATSNTYKLTVADAGKNVSVRVTGSKGTFVDVNKTSAAKAVPMLQLSATPTPPSLAVSKSVRR